MLNTVTIARDPGREVEIASGLRADDRIIDSPPDGIAAGDRVKGAGKPGQIGAGAPATQQKQGKL